MTREHHAAARHYEESLSVARAIAFPRVIASNLVGLGRLALARGQLQVSARKTLEALIVAADDKDRPGVMRALIGLALAAAVAGDYSQGAALLGAPDRLRDAMAVRRPRIDREAYDSAVTAIQERSGASATNRPGRRAERGGTIRALSKLDRLASDEPAAHHK